MENSKKKVLVIKKYCRINFEFVPSLIYLSEAELELKNRSLKKFNNIIFIEKRVTIGWFFTEYEYQLPLS